MNKFFPILLAAMALFPAQLKAEEISAQSEAVAVMDEVVVTATRSEQKTEKIPATVSVITAEEIAAANAATVPDVLRLLPGVLVRDVSGNGNEQAVDIGGFGETADRHVAVVVNGRRINPVDMSFISWATIPVENIERIEVLYGSGTVLYGDNAMGGVINIITREAAAEGVHGKVEGSYGSFDTLRGSATLNVVQGRTGLQAGYGHQQSDGYRDRSATERDTVFGKITFDPVDSTSLFLEGTYSQADYQLPGALTGSELAADRRQAVNRMDEGEGSDLALVAGGSRDLGGAGRLRLEVSYRDQDRDADMASWWSFMTFKVKTLGLNPQYLLDRPLAGRANRLTLGVDYYDTAYESWSGMTEATKTNYNDFAKETLAGYLQDEYQLATSLSLNLGARYEKADYGLKVGGGDHNPSDSEYAWNIGLAWNFIPGAKLYGRTYRSFRYPVVDEYVTYGVFNPELEPETARGYEAGLQWQQGRQLSLSLRGFLVDVDDEIAYDYLTSMNQNLDETRHQGIDLGLAFRPLEMVTMKAGLGYLKAEFTSGANDGSRVPLVPEWKGNATLELRPVEKLSAGLRYTYVGRRYAGGDTGNLFAKLDSYQTVDLSVNYALTGALELFAGAKNIFGEEYSEFAFDYGFIDGYYPMPEASYYGGLRASF
jgi:iron complex outermembrane receptor protein